MKPDSTRILLIEDNPGDARLIREFLAEAGTASFEVAWQKDLATGLAYMQENPVDIILLDLTLPDSTGFDTFKKVNEKAQNVPIILLTGLQDEEQATRAVQEGAQDYLVKGQVDSNLLVRSIRYAIERKQSKDLLLENAMGYQNIFDGVEDAILVESLSGEILDINRRACEMFGYTRAQFLTKTVADLVPSRKYIISFDPTKSPNLPLHPIETVNVRANGEKFPIELSIRLQKQKGEDVLFIVGRDITERKKTVEALHQYQHLLQSILDHTSALVYLIDLDGRYILANNAAATMFGSDPSKLIGKTPYDHLSKADADQHRQNDKTVIEKRVPITFEESDSNGATPHTYLSVKFPLLDESGKIYAVGGISTDITEQKKAEEQLQLLSRAVEQSPASIVLTNPDGIIEYVNNRFTRITGYKSDDVIGDNPRILKSGYTKPEEYQALWETILSGKEWRGEFHNRKKNGELFWESAWISPILDKNQNITHFLAVKEDTTAKKDADLALKRINRELEMRVSQRTEELSNANTALAKAAHLKDEFLASMSHELRTPLTGILGLTEALQHSVYGGLNKRQEEILQIVEESGRHLLNLINDILDLSKIEAGRMELELGNVSVDDLCQASIQLIKQIAVARQQSISYSQEPKGLIMRADARRLKQVLFNLLGNAVKFTPEGNRIGLEVIGEVENREIRFTVWDRGIGISQEEMGKLFQPFVQLDSSLSRNYPGTGLGLSLARRLVELHNGRIEVKSVVGQGSRFTVIIPWLKSETAPLLHWASAESTSSSYESDAELNLTSPGKILLVEDNEINIHMLSDYLTSQRYNMILTRSGQQALQIIPEERPDLVLMDIQMPGMDGLEVIRRIRNLPDPRLAKTLIIALTALAMPGDRERCLEAGANYYLSKPVSLNELVSIIESFLEETP